MAYINKYKSNSVILPVSFGLLSLLNGTIFPIFLSELVRVTYVSLIWEPLYGFGFFLFQSLFGFPDFGTGGFLYAIFGMVIWPLMLAVLIALGISASRERLNRRQFDVLMLAFLTACFAYFPLQHSPNLPYFSQFID